MGWDVMGWDGMGWETMLYSSLPYGLEQCTVDYTPHGRL
jgi:hypothetical protein